MKLTILACLAASAFASHCLLGWPIVLGSKDVDGDTQVSAWAEGALENSFVIGGKSTSESFLEYTKGDCGSRGCAYVTVWFQIKEQFAARWAFPKFRDVLTIQSHVDSQRAAVAFSRDSDTDSRSDRTGLSFGFIYFKDDDEIYFNEVGYSVNEVLDTKTLSDFWKLLYLNSDGMHFIVNNPDLLTIKEYFLIFDDSADWTAEETNVI